MHVEVVVKGVVPVDAVEFVVPVVGDVVVVGVGVLGVEVHQLVIVDNVIVPVDDEQRAVLSFRGRCSGPGSTPLLSCFSCLFRVSSFSLFPYRAETLQTKLSSLTVTQDFRSFLSVGEAIFG
jgi:hypothetical protein